MPICVLIILPTEAICWPPITPTVTKSPMTMVSTKIEPMTMPGLVRGMTTLVSVCQPDAPPSQKRAVDAHHRVEDRHDHEERVEVHERQDHREIREQQPFDRLAHEPAADQRLVDEAVAAEQRDP